MRRCLYTLGQEVQRVRASPPIFHRAGPTSAPLLPTVVTKMHIGEHHVTKLLASTREMEAYLVDPHVIVLCLIEAEDMPHIVQSLLHFLGEWEQRIGLLLLVCERN